MALGTVWEQVVDFNGLTEDDLKDLASWAHRVYFGVGKEGKPWYRDGVTVETVLSEFVEPASPISPEALVEVWKAIPSLQAALERFEISELDNVEKYLSRSKVADETPRYTQGDVTLKDMAANLGGITGTMVNKLCTSGSNKILRLTGGVPLMDMEDSAVKEMTKAVRTAQLRAAAEYASSLLSFNGDIDSFIQNQTAILNLTDLEAHTISQEEKDGLAILSGMEHERIMLILLEDLNSYDNLFLGFQNAASKKIFPRRSGRPKGSGKRVSSETLDLANEEMEQEPVEI